jgi:hypothetical protein
MLDYLQYELHSGLLVITPTRAKKILKNKMSLQSLITQSKVILTLACLVWLTNTAFAQNQKGKIDSTCLLIKKLGWESVYVDGNFVTRVYLIKEGKSLFNINDKNKLGKLLCNIEDSTKAITIHMLLTQILEPDKGDFSYQYFYAKEPTNNKIDIENPPLISKVVFTFNGLSWTLTYTNDKPSFSVSLEEIRKVERHWKKKIKIKKCCKSPS